MRSPRRVFGGKARKLFRFTKTRMLLGRIGGGGSGGGSAGRRLTQQRAQNKDETPKKESFESSNTLENQNCQNHEGKSQPIILKTTTKSLDESSFFVLQPTLSPTSASSSSGCHESALGKVNETSSTLSNDFSDDEETFTSLDDKQKHDPSIDEEEHNENDYNNSNKNQSPETSMLSCIPHKGSCNEHKERKFVCLNFEGKSSLRSVASNQSDRMELRPNRKRRFGTQQHSNHPPDTSKYHILFNGSETMPSRLVSTTEGTKKSNRLSTCFNTTDSFEEGPGKVEILCNRKIKKSSIEAKPRKTKASLPKQLRDYPNEDEHFENQNCAIGKGKFVYLNSDTVNQPTSQTSLLRARKFFERLDLETLAVEKVMHKAMENAQEDLIGVMSSSSPVVAPPTLQNRSRRDLSLREPGVATVYNTHLQVCREADVTPLSLKAFWEEQRKQRDLDGNNKNKRFYDGFLDEN